MRRLEPPLLCAAATGRGLPHARRRVPRAPVLAGAFALAAAAALVRAGPVDDVDLGAVRRALDDPDPMTRAAAVRRLAGAVDPSAVKVVTGSLSDPHPHVRRAAAGVLGVAVDRGVRARLLAEAPRWRDAAARREATRAFSAWADADGRAGLLRALSDRDASVRAGAAEGLAADPDEAAGQALLGAAHDADGLVRATALDGLAGRRARATRGPAARDLGAAAAAAFAAGAGDPDPRVRLSALEGSVAAAGETAAFAVGKGLSDPVWSVRLVAAELAGAVRDRRVLAPLVEALRDPRERVSDAAGRSLVRRTGIPFDADPARWAAWLAGDGAAFDPADAPARAPPREGSSRTSAAPRFLDLPLASSHVAFVLDASGSMSAREAGGATRWERVVGELDRALERLGPAAEVNVVVFADEAAPLFPRAVRLSPAVRAHVRDALRRRRPAGRTALYDGIAAALGDEAVDAVVVLSDGVPSAGACLTKSDFRAELRRANRWRRARIDVISIGTGEVAKRWRSLLDEVAADHGGRRVAR